MSAEPMDWATFYLARQLLSEETLGQRIREVEHAEDAAFEAAATASRG